VDRAVRPNRRRALRRGQRAAAFESAQTPRQSRLGLVRPGYLADRVDAPLSSFR
jgi:hypothetical protein